MTFEEALAIVTAVLAPRSLTKLQTDVFRGAWNQKSYLKISLELKHEYGYIKDIGAELWQMLTQTLGLKVTKLNLQEALVQYVQQRPSASEQNRQVDWGEAPEVSHFCGRQAQLATLEQWVRQEHCRLIAIVGQGGIGKTMLATQLAQQLAETNEFEIVVWRSLRQAPLLRDLLSELMHALVPNQPLALQLDAAMRQLLEQLRHHRCLVILDNVEAVLASNELVGTYRPRYEDYGWLLQQLGQGRHQSSIVLTSRETPAEVAIYQGVSTAIRLLRLEGLSTKEGETIFASKGLKFPAENPHLEELIQRYQGNPLALEIVATPLKDLFDGNIAAFLAQETLLFGDMRSLLTQQLNRLSLTERQVMDCLAINRNAMSAAQLLAHLKSSVSHGALLDALISLDQRSLIDKTKPALASNSISYTQQPMVMEYVTEQMTEPTFQGVEQEEIDHLNSHPLQKAQAKDNVQAAFAPLSQSVLTKLRDLQGGQCQSDATAAATQQAKNSSQFASVLGFPVMLPLLKSFGIASLTAKKDTEQLLSTWESQLSTLYSRVSKKLTG